MNDTNYYEYHFSKIEIINYKNNKSYFIEIPARELQKKYDIEFNSHYFAEDFIETKEINKYTLKLNFDLPKKYQPIFIDLRKYLNH